MYSGVAKMNTQYRTTSLLRAVLFFFILFMTAGRSAQAACADHVKRNAGTDLSDTRHGRHGREDEILRIDISVNCEWDDEENRDGIRPENVTVTLYANGLETGKSITLGEENGWSGCFEDMDASRNGEALSYSVIEERVEGYTGTIAGSGTDGYRIINIHEPLPAGRIGQNTITPDLKVSAKKGVVVETVVTTKVSRSAPARTSTTTKRSVSAKTADTSQPAMWEFLLLISCAGLYAWMRAEQRKEQTDSRT